MPAQREAKTRVPLSPKGQLRGYHIDDSARERRRALRRAVRQAQDAPHRAAAIKRRLNVLRIYRKNSRKLRARARRLEGLRVTPQRRRQIRELLSRARRNRRQCKAVTEDMQYLDRAYALGGSTASICA